MVFEIQPLYHSVDFPTIYVDEQVGAPAENVKRWLSIRDHIFDNGRQVKLLITWTACPEFPTIYEPIANIDEDGSITGSLTGMLKPDMTYKIADTPEEIAQITKIVALFNPATNELFQLPYSTMCVSQTLRNMIDDIGGMDDSPIPIGSNIINGEIYNTLRLLQMLQIIGSPSINTNILHNWNQSEVNDIDVIIRIPALDKILKANSTIDETAREAEIATAVGYPHFKFTTGWTDWQALDFYITAVDFLDIQPLCMYISHAYASKMSFI